MGEKQEKIRLAWIEATSNLGGAQFNNYYLHKCIDRKRFESVVICPSEGPLTLKLRELGVPVYIVPMRKLYSSSSRVGPLQFFNPMAVFCNALILIPIVIRLRKLLRKLRIDLMVTNGMFAHLYGGIAAKLSGVACVWDFQDIVKPRLVCGLVKKWLSWVAKRLPDAIMVPSKAVQREMFSAPYLQDKVSVIYNSADPEECNPDFVVPGLRGEYSIGAGDIVVGILSRLTRWKGHREFILAGEKILKEKSEVKFLIVGGAVFENSDYESELKLLTRQLGMEDKVIFTGFRKDIPECIASMDICVMPSVLPDPSPRVLYEGMMMGKPFVGTNIGGVPEIVVDQETGLLVPPGDTYRLAEAILLLIRHPERRIEMGCQARHRSQKVFSMDKFVDMHQCLFERTLGQRR